MPRVVVAGLGDTGVLTAMRLARHCEVVGISTKAEFVTGQELGTRLAAPERWQRDNRFGFESMRGLDRVRVLHGATTSVDLDAQRVFVRRADGAEIVEPYDALVVATGVTNGFWRRPEVQSQADVSRDLESAHVRLAGAEAVAVIGGGASAVNAAAHLALSRPGRRTDLYFPGDGALPQHHRQVWGLVRERLLALGVGLHPGHRADVPDGFDCDTITGEPVTFATGQSATSADAVVWAIGRTSPNTGWLPEELLDESGFVRVTPTLQAATRPEVFAIGDVAATDPLRCSARNRADGLLADNVRAHLSGRALGTFRPNRVRWGSVLGIQPTGIEVFLPTGKVIRFPLWSVERVLLPWYLYRGVYGGIRRRSGAPQR
jgi:NADH dehydrogenase FAD-containing subunit